MTGGSVEYASFSRLKETGSFEYAGDPPDPHDLLRVYATFREEGGGRADRERSAPTWWSVDAPTATAVAGRRGARRTYSVLKALESDVVGFPLTVPAGTVAVARAREVCEAHGLSVEASPSGYALASDHTFDANDDCLEVVNWLLGAAGFGSAAVTRAGAVRMAPYVEPTERGRREDRSTAGRLPCCGRSCRRARATGRSRRTPCALRYADDAVRIVATAVNVDPYSRSSLPPRAAGRVRSVDEQVGELAGGSGPRRSRRWRRAAAQTSRATSAVRGVPHVPAPVRGLVAGRRDRGGCAGAEFERDGGLEARERSNAETACTTKARGSSARVFWSRPPARRSRKEGGYERGAVG